MAISTEDEATILALVRKGVRAELEAVTNPDGKGNLLVRIRNSVAKIEKATRRPKA